MGISSNLPLIAQDIGWVRAPVPHLFYSACYEGDQKGWENNKKEITKLVTPLYIKLNSFSFYREYLKRMEAGEDMTGVPIP